MDDTRTPGEASQLFILTCLEKLQLVYCQKPAHGKTVCDANIGKLHVIIEVHFRPAMYHEPEYITGELKMRFM